MFGPNRIAVLTDSNSGISREEGKKLGIGILPMPFMIDEEVYFEDVDLTVEEFFEKQASGCEIHTSQPSAGDVIQLWKEALEEADSVVYIPMSSGLSSSTQTALMLAEDFDGKVQVVNNQRISVTQRQATLDAVELAGAGKTAVEIKEILEKEALEASIYIMVDTLEYLKKGGRLTPAVAAIGSALRLKPVLQIQGEKLDAFTIARSRKQAIAKMIAAMKKDIDERFGGLDNVHLEGAHTQNPEGVEELLAGIRKEFGEKEVHVDALSLSVSCHIGPGSIAIACSKKLGE